MRKALQNRYLIAKAVELIKFCFAISLISFLLVKAPAQASQIVATAGAFLLGGSKIGTKVLGL